LPIEKHGVRRRAKTLLAMLGFNLIFLVAMETTLRLVFAIWDASKPPEESYIYDPRALLPAYEGVDFNPAQLWHETKLTTHRWLDYQPYTVWSNRSHTGELVNVSPDDYRRTLFSSDDPRALRIWMIGGSTTWGVGSPDSSTLPSQIARLFNDSGVDAHVLNLAQTGFCSTQELLCVVRELQVRQPPDLLIVYDGLNEALGISERPDLNNPHYLVDRIAAIFEQRETRPPTQTSLLRDAAEATAFYRLAMSIGSRLGLIALPEETKGTPPPFVNNADIPTVAAHSADILIENYRLMAALGRQYGFRCYFFFQPQPGVSEKPMDPSEEKLLADLMATPEQNWIIRCAREQRRVFQARLARGEVPEHVFDISNVFSEVTEPLYVDWCHVSPPGNRLVARRIFALLSADLCAAPPLPCNEWASGQLAAACAARSGRKGGT